ncbi:hypothetical protein X754_21880 [Mesorhizobium sp. LNJC403B00]|nr:hypothetical protein X754_21880 [Mesorhizobium sp. LNJC403B00]
MSSASILAVCRSPDDELFATDGYWTHEKAHLAEGLVIDDVIECLEAHWPLCDVFLSRKRQTVADGRAMEGKRQLTMLRVLVMDVAEGRRPG